MLDTGIVRRVDDLGRIVIPMEIRRTLGIQPKTPISIHTDGNKIVLVKYEQNCSLCGAIDDDMVIVNAHKVCSKCVSTIKKLP